MEYAFNEIMRSPILNQNIQNNQDIQDIQNIKDVRDIRDVKEEKPNANKLIAMCYVPMQE